MNELLSNIANKVNNINKSDILALVDCDIYDLLFVANRLREKHCGNDIKFCSIVNAKSGSCSEDCKFCSQSAHYSSGVGNIPEYDLIDPLRILALAKEAQNNGSKRFGIVTSGRKIIDEKEWEKVFKTIELLKKETKLNIDASLGCLTKENAICLKEAGLRRYHHNLETSPSYFPKVCTTHSFQDRLETVKVIKGVGLELCCGGLFGLGEGWEDRIDLALLLKEIDPDSVPLNFLYPVSGTPFGNNELLKPLEILRIIAIFRVVLPVADIGVCGGREHCLRDMQGWIFYAGANSTMLGNYLTTKGRSPQDDLQLIKDLGLCPKQSL